MSQRNIKLPRIPARRTALRSQQRGVAAIVGAAAVFALVSLLALTIDVGQLYYAQRDLQKLATVAALDASRVESGCYSSGNGTQGTKAAAMTAVSDALTANGPSGVPAAVITPTVDFGRFDNSTVAGKRTFTALDENDARVDAVRVTLQRPQPALLIPFPSGALTPGGVLVASASAQHAPVASYMIGTSLLNIDTARSKILDAVFGGLLGNGSALTLSAVSYQGLANANVSITALASALNLSLADPGVLLNTQLPLPTFINALAAAAASAGQTAAASTLNMLAALADPNRSTTLGQALGIENGAEALIGALPINTLGLLNALALSASNGLYPIKLPSLGLDLGLVSVDTYLSVLQPQDRTQGLVDTQGFGRPGFAVNGSPRTYANTAQVVIAVRASLNVVGLATVRLGVDATAASATSYLQRIRCPTGVGPSPSRNPAVAIAVTPSVATLSVGSFALSNPGIPVTGGSLIGVGVGPILGLNINVPSAIGPTSLGGGGQSTLTFTGPFPESNSVGSSLDVGSAVAGLVGGLKINVCATVAGLPICVLSTQNPSSLPLVQRLVLAPVLALLTPAITAIGNALDTVVQQLFAALGIEIGSATITMAGSPPPVSYGNASAGPNLVSTVPSLFTQEKPTTVPAPGTR